MNFWSKWSHDETLRPIGDATSTGEAVGAQLAWSANWRPAILGLAVVLVGGAVVFSQTIGHTVSTWYHAGTFNHCFLILPLCVYLAWERRARLAAIKPTLAPWGLAAVAGSAAAWMLGSLAGVQLVQQFAFVALIQATCAAVFGLKAVRILVFPLSYLVFAVPFGESLVPHLQDLTAAFVVWALRLIDIPVFVDGIFLSIPTGNFVVAEACSGIRYLLATVALGFLFADLTYKSLSRKALFVALSFVVPIAANGVRAFGIVYIAYVTDHKVAVGIDHVIYGWVFFAVVTVLLIAIGTTFREPASRPSTAAAPPRAPGSIELATPAHARRVAGLVIAILAILAAARAYADYANHADRAAAGAPLQLPPAPPGWTRFDSYIDTWRPVFIGADETRLATYTKEGRAVHMFVAVYRQQRENAELVSSSNSIVDDHGWARAGSGRARAIVDGGPITVEMTRMVRRGRGRVAWHWFWVGDEYTASHYAAKALETRVKLFDEPRGAAFVAVTADYAEVPDDAEGLLREFLRGLAPLEPGLRRATGG
jgi:exosortase A